MKRLLLFLQLQAVSCFVSVNTRTVTPRTAASTILMDTPVVDAEIIYTNENEGSSQSPESFATGQISSPSTAPLLVDEGYELEKWKRRLITFEDPYSIHKLSAISYSISAIIILGTAAVRYLDSPEAFAVVPISLMLPTYIFAISNIIMCAVSVRMAFAHRRYDLTARNGGFLGVAASSMFSGFYLLWTSPFGPDVFDVHLVTQLCFALFVLLDFLFCG